MTKRSESVVGGGDGAAELVVGRSEAECMEPVFTGMKWYGYWLSIAAGLVSSWIVLDQLCFASPVTWLFPSHPFVAYIGIVVAAVSVLLMRYFRHEHSATARRVEDPSEIRSYLTEARNVKPRKVGNNLRPDDHKNKLEELTHEIERLEGLSCNEWVEYQVLNLKQMVVDFLPLDDLKMRTDSLMLELEEYAEDSSYRYDRQYLGKWQERRDAAFNNIEKGRSRQSADQDERSEPLRALLRSLYEHVSDYNMNWAYGSTIVRDLNICGIAAILAFLLAALMPVLHPSSDSYLNVLHWGLLGMVGAVTAVLLSMHRSDLVEVGNTEGRKELWRAVLSGVLGLVAGILVYGLIAGGLIEGNAIPNVYCDTRQWFCNGKEAVGNGGSEMKPSQQDFALTLIWGVAAGFSFERIFDRVRGAADPGIGQ